VTLCSRDGVPHLDGKRQPISAKVSGNDNPKKVAGRLLRANLTTLGRRSSGFNRPINYPRAGL
jgi:hypothetical protein